MKQEKNKKACMFVWNNFINDARVYRECKALVKAGFDITLVCLRYKGDNLPKKCVEDGIKVIRINTNLHLKKSLFGKLIRYILPVIKMLIIGYIQNAHFYHSNDLNTLVHGVISAKFRLRKSKLIYDSHEVQTDRTGYTSNKIKLLEDFLIKYVDKMIMTTDTRAEYVSKLYNIQKPVVIHNYPEYYDVNDINPIDIWAMCGIDKEKKILLYQGGIQEGRGLENLIEAMKYVDEGILVLIGNGKLKDKLFNHVNLLDLHDRVRFLPAVPLDELRKYTASATIGFQVVQNTCFNHYSALSNKLFEYIMAEVPVIATSGLPEIERVIKKDGCGVVVDTSDPKNIALTVEKLLSDKNQYDKCKQACVIAKEKYYWKKEENKFLRMYTVDI